jgi:hypothetical protein
MAFQFRLDHEDGTPADPPPLKAAVADSRPGSTMPRGRDRTPCVVATRRGEGFDDDPVLVVEEP